MNHNYAHWNRVMTEQTDVKRQTGGRTLPNGDYDPPPDDALEQSQTAALWEIAFSLAAIADVLEGKEGIQ